MKTEDILTDSYHDIYSDSLKDEEDNFPLLSIEDLEKKIKNRIETHR